MYYAVTTTNTAPTDNLYTTSIPTATNAGTYYVWYRVVGDANHKDSDPACVEATITGETEEETDIKVEEEELVSVPEELKGFFKDVSGLQSALEEELSKSELGEEAVREGQVSCYDVKLMVSHDGGKS